MTTVALFHSVLGVRPGFLEAAKILRSGGNVVHVVDQYDGRTFDDYPTAMAFMEGIGMPALIELAVKATADLPDGFVTMGFSNGGGMAEAVAMRRRGVSGVVMIGGAIDPKYLGFSWPKGVGGQVHTTVDDPWREQDGIDSVRLAAERVGGRVEVYDYPGAGHLFADSSKTDEFQPNEARLLWSRVLNFLRRVDVPR